MTNLPVTGFFRLTAVYGATGSHWADGHKGIDLVCDDRTVYATCCGRVRVVANDPSGWGVYVSVGDSEGRRHIFCHLAEGSVRVSVGELVTRESVIGTMGDTGNVTGVHLHYQLNGADGQPENPCPYLGIPNRVGGYDSADYRLRLSYADENEISPWAKSAVTRVTEAGIMLGDENGMFAPKAFLTREQAAVALSRILNLYGY